MCDHTDRRHDSDRDPAEVLGRLVERADPDDRACYRRALETLVADRDAARSELEAAEAVLTGTSFGDEHPDRDLAGDLRELYESLLWLTEIEDDPYEQLEKDCRERYRSAMGEASVHWQNREPVRARSAVDRASRIAASVATLTGTDAPGTPWAIRHGWAEACRRALADLQDEHTRTCECDRGGR